MMTLTERREVVRFLECARDGTYPVLVDAYIRKHRRRIAELELIARGADR